MLSINRTGHILIQLLLVLISQPILEDCNHDPNICFNAFDLKVKALVDRHLPTVRLTKKQRKTQLKPWITTGIVKVISKRDLFFRKFVQEKKNLKLKPNFIPCSRPIEILCNFM